MNAVINESEEDSSKCERADAADVSDVNDVDSISFTGEPHIPNSETPDSDEADVADRSLLLSRSYDEFLRHRRFCCSRCKCHLSLNQMKVIMAILIILGVLSAACVMTLASLFKNHSWVLYMLVCAVCLFLLLIVCFVFVLLKYIERKRSTLVIKSDVVYDEL